MNFCDFPYSPSLIVSLLYFLYIQTLRKISLCIRYHLCLSPQIFLISDRKITLVFYFQISTSIMFFFYFAHFLSLTVYFYFFHFHIPPLFFIFIIFLLFKYSLHFSTTTLPHPAHPHLPPSFLSPLWLCPWVLYTCSLTTLSLSPIISLRSPLVTLSLFFISMSLVIFCLLVCFVD